MFHVVVENPQGLSTGPCRVELDGELVQDGLIDLVDDGRDHRVLVTLLAGDFLLWRESAKLAGHLDDEPRADE